MMFKRIIQMFLLTLSLGLVGSVFPMDTLREIDQKVVFLDEQVKLLSEKLITLSHQESEQLLFVLFNRAQAMKQLFFESFLGVLNDDFAQFQKSKKSMDLFTEKRRIFNDRIVMHYQRAESFYSESTDAVRDALDLLENCSINIQMNKYQVGKNVFTFSNLKRFFIIKTLKKNFPEFYKDYLGRSESISNLCLLSEACLTYFLSSVYKFCLKHFYEKVYRLLDVSKINKDLPESIFGLDCSVSLFELQHYYDPQEKLLFVKKIASFFQLVRLCRIHSLLFQDIENDKKAANTLNKKLLDSRKEKLSQSIKIGGKDFLPSLDACLEFLSTIFFDESQSFLDDLREVVLLEYDFDTTKTLIDDWGRDLEFIIESFHEQSGPFKIESRARNEYSKHRKDNDACASFIRRIQELAKELIPQHLSSPPCLSLSEQKLESGRKVESIKKKKKKKKKKNKKTVDLLMVEESSNPESGPSSCSLSDVLSSQQSLDRLDLADEKKEESVQEVAVSSSSSTSISMLSENVQSDLGSVVRLPALDGEASGFIPVGRKPAKDDTDVFKLCDHAEVRSYNISAFDESCVDACCFQDQGFASILDVSRGSKGGYQCLACVYAPAFRSSENQLVRLDYAELKKISHLRDNNHAFTTLVEKLFGQWAVLVSEEPITESEPFYKRGYRVACTYHLDGRLVSLGYPIEQAKTHGPTGIFEFTVLRKDKDDVARLCVHRFFRRK